MSLRILATNWVDGCRLLITYQDVPGYRRLSWYERKRLDHLVAAAIFCSKPFWHGAFALAVVVFGMHVVVWCNDLAGPVADVIRGVPVHVVNTVAGVSAPASTAGADWLSRCGSQTSAPETGRIVFDLTTLTCKSSLSEQVSTID